VNIQFRSYQTQILNMVGGGWCPCDGTGHQTKPHAHNKGVFSNYFPLMHIDNKMTVHHIDHTLHTGTTKAEQSMFITNSGINLVSWCRLTNDKSLGDCRSGFHAWPCVLEYISLLTLLPCSADITA